jgi:sec-independent protein translocase protein TatA
MSIGITEIILILLAIVVLFGDKKIPELARALGKALHEFEKAKETLEKEVTALKELPKNKTLVKKPAIGSTTAKSK